MIRAWSILHTCLLPSLATVAAVASTGCDGESHSVSGPSKDAAPEPTDGGAPPPEIDAAPPFVRNVVTCETALSPEETLPPGVTLVGSELGGLGELLVDDEQVYFASGRSIATLPVGAPYGTPLSTLVADVHPWWLNLDDSFIYWFDSPFGNAPTYAMKADLVHGEPTVLATGIYAPDALAIDGEHAYIADRAYEAIFSIPLELPDGGRTPPVLIAPDVQLRAIAIRDGYIYFPELKTHSVKRVSVSGGTVETLAPIEGGAGGIAVDADDVYFGDGVRVMKAPRAGGAATQIGEGRAQIGRLVVDAKAVYFVDDLDFCDDVGKAPLDGSGSSYLVQFIPQVHGLAANADHVYVSLTTSQIVRALK